MGNILFLASLERVAIILEMKKYIARNSLDCKVIVLSENKHSPCQRFADKFILLPQSNTVVEPEVLQNIIVENNVSGIFVASNYDIESILQIENWLIDHKINFFSPDRNTLDICLSKKKTFGFLRRNQILTPQIYNCPHFSGNIGSDDLEFPLILKPDIGQGSRDVHVIRDFEELQFHYKRIDNPIIQQYISGEGYTIDCFNDLKGQLRVCVARRGLVISGAYASVSEAVDDDSMQKLALSLSHVLAIKGIWNINLIKNPSGYFIHDINPRLAAGLIYSIMSGVDFQKYIVDSLLGKNIKSWDYAIRNYNVISSHRSFILH